MEGSGAEKERERERESTIPERPPVYERVGDTICLRRMNEFFYAICETSNGISRGKLRHTLFWQGFDLATYGWE